MDFFERQESAQRKTGLLLFYFAVAVVLIVAAVDAVVLIAFSSDSTGDTIPIDWPINWNVIGVTSLVTLLVIALGTLKRLLEIRAGGSAVAGMLGARRVRPDSKAPNERKLLNVVEEMAIASGTTAPPVYVLDGEQGLNAFAAGFSPSDSVVVVTQGTLEQLSRDELQGVVAHEIAHLLNGDSRLNLKLIGMLGGILAIAGMGRLLLSGGARYRSGKRDARAEAARYGLGFALLVIGSIGLLFGKLIQAAVSRQREFLADASAVQFTRNPSGIGGALLKIQQSGSSVSVGGSDEVRHLFFAESLHSRFFRSWFATHPKIEERIQAIDPQLASQIGKAPTTAHARGGIAELPAGMSGFAMREAGARIEQLPNSLREGVRTQLGAQGVIAAFLLDHEDEISDAQDKLLSEHSAELRAMAFALKEESQKTPREQRLVLIELAVSALKLLSLEGRKRFVNLTRSLIAVDQRTTVFEFVLLSILSEQLLASDRKGARVNYYALAPLMPDCVRVLSVLAHAGDSSRAELSFRRGIKEITSEPIPVLRLEECTPQDVGQSLHRLRGLSSGLKREFVGALMACVREDGKIKMAERELLKAIGLTIDCPISIG